jgi:hypothetical protein
LLQVEEEIFESSITETISLNARPQTIAVNTPSLNKCSE